MGKDNTKDHQVTLKVDQKKNIFLLLISFMSYVKAHICVNVFYFSSLRYILMFFFLHNKSKTIFLKPVCTKTSMKLFILLFKFEDFPYDLDIFGALPVPWKLTILFKEYCKHVLVSKSLF